MTEVLVERVLRAFSGDRAHSHTVAISGFHRIQASPGYRAAAQYVAGALAGEGLEVAVHSYPADGATRFWSMPSFLEWECRAARLEVLDDQGRPVETVCDFAAIPTSLIQRSIPIAGEFDLVALPGAGGSQPGDYEGVAIEGKVVITDRYIAAVHQLAVIERGAAGILFDGIGMNGRSPLDLPDARQYTSFWWAGEVQPSGWGFVVSPRQGRRLRDRLLRGQPVRLRAHIDSRFYPGTFEVVEARLPGTNEASGEVLLVSHLCHPKPGAHDNASGVATLLESAVTLARMLGDGSLVPTRRGIRFLWIPEMTGTYAWLAAHEEELARGRWIAGLNLDMVGAAQCDSGSTWELVDLPLAGASFADHLLAWLREPLLQGQRHAETPFSAGSDHYILSDPTVGIPTPMVIQWPDRFYHTSEDTPDHVSPDSLARSGALTVAYAWWLACAGEDEMRWLANLMVARHASRVAHDALRVIEAIREVDAGEHAALWHGYLGGDELREAAMLRALAQLTLLAPDGRELVQSLSERVAALSADHRALAETALASSQSSGIPPSQRPEGPAPGEPASLVPRRTTRGPIDAAMCLQATAPERLPEFRSLADEMQPGFFDLAALLQYWADGRRTVAGAAECVALESGRQCHPSQALRYYRLLEATGYLVLEPAARG